MTFATLVFGRIKYNAVVIKEEGKERELDSAEAKDYFDQIILTPWRVYDEELQVAQSQRKAFKEGCVVRSYEQAMAEWERVPRRFGFVKESAPEPHDGITINGQAHKVAAGTADRFIDEEALRRHPDPQPPSGQRPEFVQWSSSCTKEKRTWRAELITGSGITPLDVGTLNWNWGYPIAAAVRQLDLLEKQGWKLVHVSEDHGLYAGADTIDEAYLTRVRYLIRMD